MDENHGGTATRGLVLQVIPPAIACSIPSFSFVDAAWKWAASDLAVVPHLGGKAA